MTKISANSIQIVEDGEERSVEGPPGVGDGGEPRPELRGDPLAVSEQKRQKHFRGCIYELSSAAAAFSLLN